MYAKKNGQSTSTRSAVPNCERCGKLQKEQDPKSAFVFVNERGTPFDREGFNCRSSGPARRPGCRFQVHANMLRHAAGYTLANAGEDTRSIQAYLGDKDIRHTVRIPD